MPPFFLSQTHTHHQKVWKNNTQRCWIFVWSLTVSEWIYWLTVLPQVTAVRLIHWCALDCEPSLFIYFYIFMARMTDDVLSLSPPFRLSVFPQCSKHQLLRLEPYPILLLNWMSLPHIYLICSPVVDTGFIFVLWILPYYHLLGVCRQWWSCMTGLVCLLCIVESGYVSL